MKKLTQNSLLISWNSQELENLRENYDRACYYALVQSSDCGILRKAVRPDSALRLGSLVVVFFTPSSAWSVERFEPAAAQVYHRHLLINILPEKPVTPAEGSGAVESSIDFVSLAPRQQLSISYLQSEERSFERDRLENRKLIE